MNPNDIPEWFTPLNDEKIERIDDDLFRITTDMGEVFEVTTEQLKDMSDGGAFKDDLNTLEVIDKVMANLGSRELMQTSEVMDILLDIRNSAVLTSEALALAVSLYIKYAHALSYYRETFGHVDIPGEYNMGLEPIN